jgi:hypothetical protein
MNLKIENVKHELIDIINNSGLPIGVIYYVFKDLYNDISREHSNAIMYEMRQLKEKEMSEAQENKENIEENIE